VKKKKKTGLSPQSFVTSVTFATILKLFHVQKDLSSCLAELRPIHTASHVIFLTTAARPATYEVGCRSGLLFYSQKLLLHSPLQPLWGLACSTIVEYSQQEGFYRVPLPAARQTPKLEDQWLERSNSGVSSVWNDSFIMISWYIWTSVAEGGNYGREIAENFTESGDFHVTFGFFYMP